MSSRPLLSYVAVLLLNSACGEPSGTRQARSPSEMDAGSMSVAQEDARRSAPDINQIDAAAPAPPPDAASPTDGGLVPDAARPEVGGPRDAAPPPASDAGSPVTVRMLTDGWMDATFGPTTRNGPTKPGSAAVNGTSMKITGFGSGLVAKRQIGPESFYFVWKPLKGDGAISAKIVSSTHEHDADVAVMIRARLDPTASHGASGVRPTDDTVDGYSAGHWRRYEISGAGVLPRMAKGLRLPLWVRAERSGSTITASYSLDGVTWKTIGAQAYTDLPETTFAGIAVMSGWSRATAATTTEIEQIKLEPR